jgi:2-dehydropantoate 2-reductase
LRCLVFGAGAIGSVFAGLLAKSGEDVYVIARQSHVDAIREQGLHITGIWGEHRIAHPHVYSSVDELQDERFDVVLLSVKSYDTESAARASGPLLKPDGLMVSLQNGLGNVEKISEIAGSERAVGGRVIFGVEFKEPGHVDVTVYAEPVMLGSPGGTVSAKSIQVVVDAINNAGIPCEYTEEIDKYIWAKVLYNISLNPLSTVLGVNYGYLLENAFTPDIMRGLVDEAFHVARACGQPLFWEQPGDYIKLLFGKLIPVTAAHHPSMLQDIQRRKPTEIDALNGALVQIGMEHGVVAPMNLMLTRLIKALEERSGKTG